MSHETEKVENFIFNDKVQNILSHINDNVMDFNVLEITGMGTQEIKHSNVLGWLFDDSEHNLEYQILDNFLKKVTQKKGNDSKELQSYLYLLEKKRNITFYREKNNIDLLIVDEANKVVFIIENKVYASESETQLEEYENKIDKIYTGYRKYFIFLTIDSEEAIGGDKDWLIANHQMIADVIEDILKTKEITKKTKIIFESYVDLLKRNGIVADKNLDELCRKIWANKDYANALDILIEHRISSVKSLYEILKERLNFFEDTTYLELTSIKTLHKRFNKVWEDVETPIFEIQCNYFGGKNEYIWIGFLHRDLINQDNDFQKICRNILNKNNKTYETILEINKTDLSNKEIDIVVQEVVDKVNSVDQLINENIKQT